mgnify:CR=1 FL=1
MYPKPLLMIRIDDKRFDPVWQAAIDLKLPLSFHILTSGNDQPTNPQFRGPVDGLWWAIVTFTTTLGAIDPVEDSASKIRREMVP